MVVGLEATWSVCCEHHCGGSGGGGLQVVPNWHSPNLRHGNKIQTQTKSIENFVFKKTWEANIESVVCTHFLEGHKVNTTKYINMVSITSIETKLVQKSQITIAQIVALKS